MTAIDHIYFLVVALLQPVAGFVTFKRLLRRAERGERINLKSLYNRTIISQWALFGLLLTAWILFGRHWSVLGFSLQLGNWFAAGFVLFLVASGLLLLQTRRLHAAGAEDVLAIRKSLGRLEFILPATRKQLSRFYGVSLTAGIVEETIWRGFMIWYLSNFMPDWAAVIASSIGFGLAHAYQGIAYVPRSALVGAVFALIYLLTGSLWLSMLLHAALDMLQGRSVYRILRT